MTSKRAKRREGLALYACDFCKHRKIRCTLVLDKCKECHIRGLECTFVKSKDRKCYLRGKLREKHEWKNSIIVWSVDESKKPCKRESDSKLEGNPSRPSKISIVLRSHASELTLEEFKILEDIISYPLTVLGSFIKEKLPLMLASLYGFDFRFFINTVMALYYFTCIKSQLPLTYDSSELDIAISYYFYAVEAIPFLNVEDTLIWHIFTLLDEVRILSKGVIA